MVSAMVSAGLESERQALGTKSEVRRPVSLLLVRGHGVAFWEEPRGAACWAYPGAICGAPLSSALWSSRGARIEGVRPNDATADTAASGTRQHGPTGPRPVQSAVRSAVRSRRSAAAPRLTLSVTPSVRTAGPRTRRESRHADRPRSHTLVRNSIPCASGNSTSLIGDSYVQS
jgi:hypothetical protein